MKLADEGLNDVKKGFSTAASLPTAESRNQLRALTYNGLITLGYLRLARGKPLDAEERSLAAEWLAQLDRRDTDGRDRHELRKKEWGFPLVDLDLKHAVSDATSGQVSGTGCENIDDA